LLSAKRTRKFSKGSDVFPACSDDDDDDDDVDVAIVVRVYNSFRLTLCLLIMCVVTSSCYFEHEVTATNCGAAATIV